MIQAEAQHRDHAIVEQVFADLTAAPSRTCHQGISPPMLPGWAWPPSAIT